MQTTNSIQPPVEVTTRSRIKTLLSQEDDSSIQQAALTALNTLTTNCTNAIKVVNDHLLGPYPIKGSCTHDCSYEQTWSWDPNYQYVNSNLNSAINVLNINNSYTSAFELTRTWISTHLQIYSTTIIENINLIKTIDKNIIAQGGTPTQSQKDQLTQAFDTINTTLISNLTEADNAFKSILNFINNQKVNTDYLQNQSTVQLNSIKTSVTNAMNNLLGKIACGGDKVKSQFGAIITDVTLQFTAMQPSFDAVTTSFQQALKAIELVAGVFLTIQSDSQLVSNYISKVQCYPDTSPLRIIDLNIALNEWNDLLNKVKNQLS